MEPDVINGSPANGKGETANGIHPDAAAENVLYTSLKTVLRHLGLPATVDRTAQPRRPGRNDVTIVVLGELDEALSVFFEGNRQYPNGVFLAMLPSWLERKTSPSDVTSDTLYLRKAVTADEAGRTYLDSFSPPRRVTYLANQMAFSSNDDLRSMAEDLTKLTLDTPMSSSDFLQRLAGHRLTARITCAVADVKHPATLAFWLPWKSRQAYSSVCATVRVIRMEKKTFGVPDVEPYIHEFFHSGLMDEVDKVMISSFGYKENKLPSPTPFSTSDLSGITSAVLDLLNCPDSGDGVLLEAFYRSFHPAVPTGIGRHAVNVGKTKHDFRVTTVVSRTPLDGARVTQVVCSIGDLCGSGIASSVPSSLEMTLRKWGITDTTQQKAIRDTVRGAAEKILLVLIDREKNATSTDRGAKEACTEILGVELVITKIDDVFIPVVTNIKAQGFLHQMSLFENINPVHRGQAARTWVQTMLFRSQKFIMKGKTLVIVGGGGYSNRQTWTDILDFGVKVVLVESDQDHFAKGQVHRFLHLDIDYHSRDLEHADVIVKFVQSQIGHVDGCLTFLEDNVPLASLVGEALHLPHTPSYKAAVAAKTKGLTQSVLFSTAPPLHVMPPSLCSSPVVRLNGVEDLHNAVKQVPLPAVMKFEYGMQAVGVKHVRTFEEALSHMQHVPTILGVKDGLGHGDSMVLMPRLLGTEHDVDIVLMEGQLMAGFVMDHGPTHEPMCSETVISSPSVLSGEQQRQLVAAAAASCTGIGLDTGVFAVEMMMTPRGPKLLEINARLGALYTRVFHRLIYGVDLLYLALMAACGVRPVAGSNIVSGYTSVQAREDNGQLIAFPLYPKRHGKALATSASPEQLQRLHDQGTILYLQFHEGIELRDDEFDQAFALLAVRAPTLEEARTKLLATCTALELETEDTMVEILQDLVFA